MAKDKTLSISKVRLEEYLSRFCSHHHTMMNSDRAMCDRVRDGQCNVDMTDKIVWACPHDCPHWAETKWKDCEPQKCSYIQKAIKEITEGV